MLAVAFELLALELCFFICVYLVFCLFDLILYVPVNSFSIMSGWVFLGWTSTKAACIHVPCGMNF